MSKNTFSGRNLEVAKKKASKQLGKDINDLQFEILAGEMGGMALIRVVEAAASAPAEALTESLSGDAIREDGSVETMSEEEAAAAAAEDERRRERRGRDRDDRGGRGRGRGRDRDRDGRGRGRGRGRDRDRDRGGRDDRGGRRRRRAEPRLPDIPSDGPAEVTMQVADGAELSELAEDAHEVMRDILTGMGFGMSVKMTEDDATVHFDLDSGVYHPALVANNMELLEAVQHLVDKIVNFDADNRKRIVVDSQGAKAESDAHLGESARQLADKVKNEGQPVKIGPLDPRSRRIVHMALRDIEGVTTKSEGEGAFRRVCILPAS